MKMVSKSHHHGGNSRYNNCTAAAAAATTASAPAMDSQSGNLGASRRAVDGSQHGARDQDFEFVSPPEAPVFEPTTEEFLDPLGYIAKIRPIAEKSGICKIKPPPNWQPPFAVDVDKFKFTPRIQRLNELEAKTRIKLNFLDQIAKFWELQGSSLKIPLVERKALDLYSLHRIVTEEGGIETVTKERRWAKVANKLGYPSGRSVGSILKSHYERILYPFDIFKLGKTLTDIKIEPESDVNEKKDRDYKPHGIISRQQIKPPQEKFSRRSKRFSGQDEKQNGCASIKQEDCKEELDVDCKPPSPVKGKNGTKAKDIKTEDCKDNVKVKGSPDKDSVRTRSATAEKDKENSKELKKLQFYGAGPKMAGFNTKETKKAASNKTRGLKLVYEYDPLAKYICHNCGKGDDEENMLLCDGCDDSYHTFCLLPPLTEIPKGDWRCPKCVAEEVSKPMEAFGFEQAQREYTLQQFGEMADQFKSDYFNIPVHMVPTELVEKEFWRIVSSIDEDVTVEYGADLHTMDHGSGFPTKTSVNLFTCDQEYAESAWNLNNLPVLPGSVLGHINADISGMKVPWMYVGMCFATFCWHNEDHWSYSINYLHWGEPKTWYGVPGYEAERFEKSMKSAAPELFHSQPDLLHQLVTIMNPNILTNEGVPVYRTDQHAGEFVVTFPRAYHAGFNQGYNFAEAVNFAPADWLKMGRDCIAHYSNLRRFCVFSHDELVCKMSLEPDTLNIGIATATYHDMLAMVEEEKKLRKNLLEWGVTEAEREAFELLPDDERQCEACKTTCFLSAVTCSCSKSQLVCLRHITDLCQCPPEKHTLRYRYTLDELPIMLQKLKLKAESFDSWASKVKEAMDPKGEKIELNELKELLDEAETKKFPESELLTALTTAVQDAEKCASVARQLLNNKQRTRTRQSVDAKFKLTVEELTLFYQEITTLCCELKEADGVKYILDQVLQFQKDADELETQENDCDMEKLEKCIEYGDSICIELPQLAKLKQKLQQLQWLEEIKSIQEEPKSVTRQDLGRLIEEGMNIPPHSSVENALAQLQSLMISIDDWEDKAKLYSQASKNRQTITSVEEHIMEAEKIDAYLPGLINLKDILNKAKNWIKTVEEIQARENFPYYDTLDELVRKGRTIPLHLPALPTLESTLAQAKIWKDRTAKTFLRKNSHYTLMEALSPRIGVGLHAMKNRKNSKGEEAIGAVYVCDTKLDDSNDSATVVAAFKLAEKREMEAMKNLRERNINKMQTDDSRFCVCRRAKFGQMLRCELCKDWFHTNCVPVPRTPYKGKQQNSRVTKFLCPCCLRSRRPRLETILSLLVSLQKIPIRLPEGEALQCLTERAMNWQDRARQALSAEEVSSVLAKLSSLSQKLNEAAAREKTEKIISTELKKAANNPELHHKVKDIASMSGIHSDDSVISVPDEEDEGRIDEDDDDDDLIDSDDDVLTIDESEPSSSTFNSNEHAYSTATTDDKEKVVTLSAQASTRLEELMMEGDLLEVALDETEHIWRILSQTLTSSKSIRKYAPLDQATPVSDNKEVKKTPIPRGRKRKSDEVDIAKKFGRQRIEDKTVVKRKSLNKDAKLAGTGAPTTVKRGPRKVNRKDSEGLPKRRTANRKKTKQDTSDEEEDCAATKCLRPNGREVDWVQCDGGCNGWFHMHCVGLDRTELTEEDDYICSSCEVDPPSPQDQHSLQSSFAELTEDEDKLQEDVHETVRFITIY
ncbi:lysine-specific demethylase 5 isoform X2 [Phymastichus coffea]|uniref:lysine-specific demethylase 5 isoform X2 n=1 Tax=Phymastichus coffea TaxID=108790 RepID=UPI00273C0562|nr:lysine-specific demethylase 5 isoform X2 [Phymastichus coffea]